MSQRAARARATRRAGPGCRCGPQATPPAGPCQAASCRAPARGMPARAPLALMASRPRWGLDCSRVHLARPPVGHGPPVQQASRLACADTSTSRQHFSYRDLGGGQAVSRLSDTASGTTWLSAGLLRLSATIKKSQAGTNKTCGRLLATRRPAGCGEMASGLIARTRPYPHTRPGLNPSPPAPRTAHPPPRLWSILDGPRSRACAATLSVSPWPGAGATALPPPRGAPPRGAAHSLPPAPAHTAAAVCPPAARGPRRGAPWCSPSRAALAARSRAPALPYAVPQGHIAAPYSYRPLAPPAWLVPARRLVAGPHYTH